MKFPLKRMKVEPPEQAPASHIDMSTDDLISQLQRVDAYRLILDVGLAPELNGTTPVAPYFTQARWSPSGSLANAQCSLAGVTNLGQASLFCQQLSRWASTCDLTAKWAGHCQGAWRRLRSTEPATVRLAEVEERANQLRTTAIAWGFRCHADYTHLVTAQRNNDIVLFRVERDGTARVEASFPSRLDRVTSLKFVKEDAVAVGDGLGRAKLFTFKSRPEPTVETFIVPEETNSLPPTEPAVPDTTSLTIDEHDLWSDSDRVAVTHFELLRHALVVFKGSYLIVISLDDYTLATHHVDGINIGGVTVLDEDSVVITTECGQFHVVTVRWGAVGELKVTSSPLTCSFPNTRNRGVTRSKGKAIWAVINSTDDVSNSVPSQVTFFHVTGLVNPMSVVVNNPSADLSQCYDQLELIRSIIFSKAAEQELHIDGLTLPDEPQFDALTNIYELKTWRWFMKIKTAISRRVAKKDDRLFTMFPVEQNPLDVTVLKIEQLITYHHVCSRLTLLTSRCRDGQVVSQLDLDSVYLMRAYLNETYSDRVAKLGPVVGELVLAALRLPIPQDVPTAEYCALCGKESSLSSYERSTCELSHVLPRCMISLAQVLSVPYLICQLCERVAHPDVDGQATPKCVFCDKNLELLSLPGFKRTVKPVLMT